MTVGSYKSQKNDFTERNREKFGKNSYIAAPFGRYGLRTSFSGGDKEKEKCPSGRRSTPGKCVYLKRVSRVRIPPSPPERLKGRTAFGSASPNRLVKKIVP